MFVWFSPLAGTVIRVFKSAAHKEYSLNRNTVNKNRSIFLKS